MLSSDTRTHPIILLFSSLFITFVDVISHCSVHVMVKYHHFAFEMLAFFYLQHEDIKLLRLFLFFVMVNSSCCLSIESLLFFILGEHILQHDKHVTAFY